MKSTLIAAAFAALPMAAFAALPITAIGAPPNDAGALPSYIRIAHGQSLQNALQQARFHAGIDALRATHATPPAETKVTQPTLTGGTIMSTTLTVGKAGSIPEVEIGYKTGPSGLAGITLVFTSPSGNASLSVNYSPQGLATHERVTVEQPGTPPPYSQPGQWQLTAAYLADYAGNYVSYTQSQLATLFPQPYITIVNDGPVDVTPPTVRAGKILTPTVSLSSPVPVFEASLTAKDDVSGLYEPYVGIEQPGGSYGQVDSAPMPFPLKSGKGTAYSTIFSSQPTGTWSITLYAFCDVVGNCVSDSTPADIQALFGTTTFQVTP